MRVVYHAHYVDYFEAARTEALRAHGLPYKALEDAGIIMPVVELNVRYHQPARYDDLLEVTVRFPDVPGARVTTEYEVRRAGEERLLVTGRVVLCFVDGERGRPVRAPQPLLDVFSAAEPSPS
jgi:acyl-CoA thioester hydrolase